MRITAFLLLFLASIIASAQTTISSLTLRDTIVSAMIDRPGDLYIITKSGQLQKYDENGKMIVSLTWPQRPTLFDPRDGARLFAYFRDTQQYKYLNPSLDITRSAGIDSAFAINPWLICPSGDTKLWVLDIADQSIKKIDPKESVVEVEVVIDSKFIPDASVITTMREYQGFLFLLHPAKGIYVFNGLGKYIKTIEAKNVNTFQFLGEELYYVKGKNIHLFNLFTADTRTIELTSINKFALLTDRRLFQLSDTSVIILDFTP